MSFYFIEETPSILYRTQKNIRMIPLFNVVGFVPFDLSLAFLAVLTLYWKSFRRVWWMSNFHFISQCTRQRKAAGNFLERIWLPCSHNSEPKVKGRSIWCSSVTASLRMKHFGCLQRKCYTRLWKLMGCATHHILHICVNKNFHNSEPSIAINKIHCTNTVILPLYLNPMFHNHISDSMAFN